MLSGKRKQDGWFEEWPEIRAKRMLAKNTYYGLESGNDYKKKTLRFNGY
jgi:hypothetical protein